MAKTIDYYFFTISPFAYLGSAELERVAQDTGARINVRPIQVKTVFQETGGVPPAQRPQPRQDYRFVELDRWSQARGLPLTKQPAHFPVPDLLSCAAIYAAEEQGGDPLRLAHAILKACWAEERDVFDRETLHAIAGETGHDADALIQTAEGRPMAQKVEQMTGEAIDRGVFGSPWYIVDGEPFWGQDRLDMVARKLD
ncbi:2-hydroxychromene-2-carboxylate isomerase [Rhodovibrio salinarum]|nr:2-hydroxychromene-2-carboxylate isomerase [Rhodovibrio salinarum]